MKVSRIALHSLALAAINLASILVGFGLWYVTLRGWNQVGAQGLIAGLLSVALFAAWVRLLPVQFLPDEARAWVFIYLGAFPAFALLFVPAHFIGSGYLTSLGNLTASWTFQAPVNLVACLLGFSLADQRLWHAAGRPQRR